MGKKIYECWRKIKGEDIGSLGLFGIFRDVGSKKNDFWIFIIDLRNKGV